MKKKHETQTQTDLRNSLENALQSELVRLEELVTTHYQTLNAEAQNHRISEWSSLLLNNTLKVARAFEYSRNIIEVVNVFLDFFRLPKVDSAVLSPNIQVVFHLRVAVSPHNKLQGLADLCNLATRTNSGSW